MRRVKKNSGVESEPVFAIPGETKRAKAKTDPNVSKDFFIGVGFSATGHIIPEKKSGGNEISKRDTVTFQGFYKI